MDKQNTEYVCPYKSCKSTFSRRYKLEDHINMHTGEKPFKCKEPRCNREYHTRNSLSKHIKLFHKQKSSLYKSFLRCPHPSCMMELGSKHSLNLHYKRRHAGQFKFMCQYCDRGFYKHKHLQSHVFHHTGIPPYRCATCDTGFVYQRELNRHLRGHRSWKCDVNDCGLLFHNWNLLRSHLASDHSGEFICDTCNKTFKTKYALRVHVVCHLEATNRPKLVCPHENCERSYFHKKNLDNHIRVKHKGKLHECPECGKKLCSNTIMRKHMKVFHKRKHPVQTKNQTKCRKTRKDAGMPHQSMAVKLSGIFMPHEEERLLLENEYKALSKNVTEATAVSDSITETPKKSLKMQKLTPDSFALRCDTKECIYNSLYCHKLDVSETIIQGCTNKYNDKDISIFRLEPTSGNLHSATKNNSNSECDYDKAQNNSNKESDKENVEYKIEYKSPSVLEHTKCLNSKNTYSQKYEKNELYDCDTHCKIQKNALKNVVDADHNWDLKKEWCQMYTLKKWILIMKGMMELVCPKVSSDLSSIIP